MTWRYPGIAVRTYAKFVNAMETVRDFDLGGYWITFAAREAQWI
jgi:hypothetical protein